MRKPVLLVLLVVLGLSVAACGSSGSDDASDETTTTAAADDAGDDAADETTTTQGGEPGEDGEPGDDEVPEPVDVSEEEYVDALTTNLSSGSEDDGDLVLSDEEAACLAPQWVDAITVDLLQQQGVTVEDLSDPGFDGADLGMELAQGEAMVAAFGACDIDVVALFTSALSMGLEPDQQACIGDNVDPALVEDLLAASFSTGDSDAEFSAITDQLSTACDLPG
jgi:hypothetical protein